MRGAERLLFSVVYSDFQKIIIYRLFQKNICKYSKYFLTK